MNLQENIQRIKKMMGLNEDTSTNVTNEKDLINNLLSKGYQKLNDPNVAKNYKIDLSKYTWIYYKPQNKTYLAKFKDNTTMFGVQSKFDPKTETKIPSNYKLVKSYPIDLTEYEEFFNAPIVDESFDLLSIVRDLDSIRNMYHGFIEKDEATKKPRFVESKKFLSDSQIKVYIDSIKERMIPNMEYINKLNQPEDKTKQVKSEKFGDSFNNIYDYYKFVEKEAKGLGIY